MNNVSLCKIVSINAAGGERAPGLRIVGECTDWLGDAFCNWLAALRQPIEDELFGLADGTRDRELQSRYLNLRRDVERDWTRLIEAFRHGLTEGKRAACSGTLDVPDFDGLQLVDDASLAEHIVVREFAAQLAETCDEELYALDRRVAALLGHEETADGENPLGPEMLCRTLVDASARLGLGAEDRLLLLRRIERHLHLVLPGFYREINAQLGTRGILPDLKRSYRRGNVPAAGSALQEAVTAIPASTDILGIMQRLVSARSAPAGSLPASAGEPTPAGISHAFLASLNEAQHTPWQAGGTSTTNQIQVVRSLADAQHVSPLESVTIDIVAMLFDFVFNDDELPDSVKLLVGRLQIPVLKVAMLDQSFFANRQHPARRFLDGITGIALHWGMACSEGDPFLCRLAEVVERIQREFETNIEIFAEAIGDLESFVRETESEETKTLGVAAEAAARREAAEAVAEAAHSALAPILAQTGDAVVHDFLVEHWAIVLQQKGLADGEGSAAWQDTVDVAEQLVWSVAAKTSAEERMRLIGTLPTLLARINAGLVVTGISSDTRRGFFDALVELHAAALKGGGTGGEAPSAGVPPASGGATSADDGDLLVSRRIEDGVTIEDVMLVGAPSGPSASDQTALAVVRGLQRGCWVDFTDAQGHVARERLNWVSPSKGILVFSNHRAAKAISISPEALARQIRDGVACVVSEEISVFGKAIDGVMQTLGAA